MIFILTVFSCRQVTHNEISLSHTNIVAGNNPKHKADVSIIDVKSKLDHIIFGRFCGECAGECATMYKLDVLNNTLAADHTDSYWKYTDETPMKFETAIHDKTVELLARQVLDSIPDFMMNSQETTQRYGCPDFTDGCGMFLEIKKDNTVRKFYIDYQIGKLTGQVKIFADQLKKIINQI